MRHPRSCRRIINKRYGSVTTPAYNYDISVRFDTTICFTFKTLKDITKKDIIEFCELLNDEHEEICTFEPDRNGVIIEKNMYDSPEWIKTVSLCPENSNGSGVWDWQTNDVMTEWGNSDDIILSKDQNIKISFKHINGSGFLMSDLYIYEHALYEIGIVKVI